MSRRILFLIGIAAMFATSATALTMNCVASFEGSVPAGAFGTSIAVADFNGDGTNDLAAGDPGAEAVNVYQGSITMSASSNVTIDDGSSTAVDFGNTIAVGDFDKDGFYDLVVDQLGKDADNPRTVYVYMGSSSFFTAPTITVQITGECGSSAYDLGASYVADVNADTYDDLIMVSPGPTSREGQVKIWLGDALVSNIAAWDFNNAWLAITGEAINDMYGETVWIGENGDSDFNGDGFDDVVVHAPGYNGSTGKNYVYFAGNNFSSLRASMVGDAANNEYGEMAAAGRLFGSDNYRDLVLASYLYNNNQGIIKGYSGGTTMTDTAYFHQADPVANNNDYYGFRLKTGDTNGDGIDDLVLQFGGYNGNAGLAYNYAGPIGSSLPTPAQVAGENPADRLNRMNITDLNKDGYDDVILGAWGYNSYTGKVYVYLGSDPFAFGTADWAKEGEGSSASSFGIKLSVGDVNGDGFDELIVVAPGYDSDNGKIYVYTAFAAKVVQPNGGESIASGTYTISWEASEANLTSAPIDIHYSTNEGSSWIVLAENEDNDGSYLWTIPAVDTTRARVRITSHDNYGNTITDVSNANFTLQGTAPNISLTAPNGSEVWQGGSSHDITWTASEGLLTFEATPISLYYTSGETEPYILITSGLLNSGSYSWSVPYGERSKCKVKVVVTDFMGNEFFDASNDYFSITDAPGGDPVVSNVKAGPIPFNPDSGNVKIQFDLDQSGETTLLIFDLNGNLMFKRKYTSLEQGGHIGTNTVVWDGTNAFGNRVSNGVYIYKIISGGSIGGGGKMIVLR
ncbi:MAG: FG-GAP repeat protein [Candidatus Margulisbacteria bacterium]|nr:FG-GAP repeat protein [Candidatus Margulisiibacteriota bacterium]